MTVSSRTQVREERRAAEESLQELRARVVELEAEADGFYKRLYAQEALGRELAAQLEGSKQAQRGLKSDLEAKEAAVLELTDIQVSLKGRVEVLEAEVGALRTEKETVAAERDRATRELAEARDRLKAAKDKNKQQR